MVSNIRYADYWTEGRAYSATSWIDAEEARRRYEVGDEAFTAVIWPDSGEEAGRPLAAVSIGQSRRVGVIFLDEHGTRKRSVDYDWRDGRLWRWITTDFEYPDDSRRYRVDRATRVIKAKFEPNGNARVEIRDRIASPNEKDVVTAEEVPVQGFWLDRPPFGEWSDLLNPDYGVSEPRPANPL
ncbi:hypothetical protein [Cellulomonas oligotrophica]|uniref:Uncharacterized protein n=1 Tax=Cellulomonas oligotrophica TaxID=931536 RepID=A0A7Y9FII9_9CELL|nr:hypothetical protein [Cellulomonas oligotrophica]NYD87968.1 hypothetical protein [Cellulomonas oligotrophica]GIG34464.1 hypothetical protein Col01nite_36230 [Cellulomonas oligotrophica]